MSNPYQIDPPPPPGSSSSGGNTVLIIVAIIGGFFFLIIAGCALSGFLLVRGAKNKVEQFGQQIQEEMEKSREDMADAYVKHYALNKKLKDEIGNVKSHSLHKTKSSFSTAPMRIDVEGEKGSGVLVINMPHSSPSTNSSVFLEVGGKRISLQQDIAKRASLMSASRMAVIKHVNIRVESVKFGPIPANSRTGLDQVEDGKSYLQVALNIQNMGPGINFLGWDSKQLNVALVDQQGNEVKKLTDSVIAPGTLKQFEQNKELLVFDFPSKESVKELKTVNLHLPGAALGESRDAYLRVDTRTIR